jgi:hypothetical protein
MHITILKYKHLFILTVLKNGAFLAENCSMVYQLARTISD